MSYNKVRVLQEDVFDGLKSLVRLHMDHNKIEFVNPYVFYGLTSLRLVHLEGNLLKQLHPDTFVTLRYSQIFKISFMKHIYLSDNTLTSLPQEMFSYMSELESIYLHGNPWSCDCNLQWFAEWAKARPGELKALFMLLIMLYHLALSNKGNILYLFVYSPRKDWKTGILQVHVIRINRFIPFSFPD